MQPSGVGYRLRGQLVERLSNQVGLAKKRDFRSAGLFCSLTFREYSAIRLPDGEHTAHYRLGKVHKTCIPCFSLSILLLSQPGRYHHRKRAPSLRLIVHSFVLSTRKHIPLTSLYHYPGPLYIIQNGCLIRHPFGFGQQRPRRCGEERYYQRMGRRPCYHHHHYYHYHYHHQDYYHYHYHS